MNNPTVNDLFRDGLLGKMKKNFPYPIKNCVYCEHDMTAVDAIHIEEDISHYKVLYICMNNQCEAFDEPARKAYARVYYSSNQAYILLETHRIWYANEAKK